MRVYINSKSRVSTLLRQKRYRHEPYRAGRSGPRLSVSPVVVWSESVVHVSPRARASPLAALLVSALSLHLSPVLKLTYPHLLRGPFRPGRFWQLLRAALVLRGEAQAERGEFRIAYRRGEFRVISERRVSIFEKACSTALVLTVEAKKSVRNV